MSNKTTQAPNQAPSRKVKLYGPNSQPLKSVTVEKPNIKSPASPFNEDSPLNKVIEFLHEHGPAAAKLFLMMATGAATAYGGWTAGGGTEWLIMLMVWGCGFIVECAFAYSWVMKGSEKLAGAQVGINDRIHNRSSLLMIGALVTMLFGHQTAVTMPFIIWTSVFETIGAVWIIHQFYKLKGSHPMAMAEAEIVTLAASVEAEKVREQARDFKLLLSDAKLMRNREGRKMMIEHEESARHIESNRYRKMIRAEQEQEIFSSSVFGERSGLMGKAWKMLTGRNN